MKRFSKSARIISALVAFVLLLGMAVSGFFLYTGGLHAQAANAFNPHPISVHPKYVSLGVDASGPSKFQCQNPNATIRCYGPKQIRTAYDIQRVLDAGINGTGTTIVIIDAFQSPTLRHDLNLFNTEFGLDTAKLKIIAPDGLTPFNPHDPNQVSWSGEISLDVEWAHAIAPDATIDLVLAKSNMDADLLSATKYAVDNSLGQVMSMSFGEAESCMDPKLMLLQHQVFEAAVEKGITLLASSGDYGAAQLTCDGTTFFLSVSTPASDPLVTAVGGTHLNADPQAGQYDREVAWNDKYGASGGGFSTVYVRPSYQLGTVHATQRGVPDLAFDADPNGGVLVVWSSSGQGANLVFIFGGTSVGSPSVAGEVALVNQAYGRMLGNMNIPLYLNLGVPAEYFTSYHDAKFGNNTFTGAGSNGKIVTISGYNARDGWDPVTGLGSFDLGNLFFGITGEDFQFR